jgi:hypothetical protein
MFVSGPHEDFGPCWSPAGRRLFLYFLIVTDTMLVDKQILGEFCNKLAKFRAKAMRRISSDLRFRPALPQEVQQKVEKMPGTPRILAVQFHWNGKS